MKRKSTLIICLTLALFVTGCATVDGSTKRAPSDLTTRQTSTPSNQLVNQGLVYLRDGNYEDAQKVFSAAVKLSPSSATVHVLNGISYHLEFLKGVPDSKTLAETAYGVAYSLDKSDSMPLIQLGRLHVDSGEYRKAKKDFVRAVSISPQSADALYGLLQAGLLQKDLKTGRWAGSQLAALNPATPDQQKMLAIMYSLTGNQELATEWLKKYEANSEADSPGKTRLRSQLDYIDKQNRLALAQLNQGDFMKTASPGTADAAVKAGAVSNLPTVAPAKPSSLPGAGGSGGQNSGGQNTGVGMHRR